MLSTAHHKAWCSLSRFVEGALKGLIFVSELNALVLHLPCMSQLLKAQHVACCTVSTAAIATSICCASGHHSVTACIVPCMHSSLCMPEMLPMQETFADGIRFSEHGSGCVQGKYHHRVLDT